MLSTPHFCPAGTNAVTASARGITLKASFSLTNAVNQAPKANLQSVSVSHDQARSITLSGTDANNPPLTLTYTVTASPSHGKLSGTVPKLTYTPDAGRH